jgi:hypothetical protein
VLDRCPDWPERQEAMRYLVDRLDLPRETQAGLAPRARASTGTISPKLLQAGDRLERDALAGCATHPELLRVLAELTPEHFDSEEHRLIRAFLLEPRADPDLDAVRDQLEAHAEGAGIDEETTEQMLLRLRDRQLRRELEATDDPRRVTELQAHLARVRAAVREFS